MPGSYATCCVLSYERPSFLRYGIESLIANAGAPFQLIVHDDGSTNPRVAEELERARRLGATVITNPTGHNEGQGVALNRMFHMASGDPIIKLDQDLTYKPGWLDSVNRILSSNRQRSKPSHQGDVYRPALEPNIGLLGLLHYHHDPVMSVKCKLAQYEGWQEHTHILGSAFALTRDCWLRLGPFEEHSEAFAEDWIMQRKVTDSAFVCALPDSDLVENHGMGLAHSTVVVGEGQVRPIHKEPHVFG